MDLALALLALLAALAPALVPWLKGKLAPSPEQRAADAAADVDAQWARVAALERAGDYAGADALRRRLLDSLAPEHRPGLGTAGQQLPPPAPGGDGAPPA